MLRLGRAIMNHPSYSSQRSLLMAVALFCSIQSGCQWVLGDFEMEEPGATGGATGQGGTPGTSTGTSTVCANGQPFYCNVNVLVDCRTGQQTACARQNLCRATATEGVCLACSDAETRCNGALLEVCNAAYSGWVLHTNCGATTEPACEPDLKACVTCLRNSKRCDGTHLLTCKADRSGWDSTPCDTTYNPVGCVTDDAATAHCVVCDPATFVVTCSASTLVTCVDGQIVRTACSNGCAPATNGTTASCL